MSIRARAAYDGGEMPASKWTKAAMLAAIADEFDSEIAAEFAGLKKAELFAAVMRRSSWHHTGKFANATDFYAINRAAVLAYAAEHAETMPNAAAEAEKAAKKDAAAEAEKQAARIAALRLDLEHVGPAEPLPEWHYDAGRFGFTRLNTYTGESVYVCLSNTLAEAAEKRANFIAYLNAEIGG